jgi:hypothetical protein
MWKIAFLLLLAAMAVLLIGLAHSPLPPHKTLPAMGRAETTYVYAGVRG